MPRSMLALAGLYVVNMLASVGLAARYAEIVSQLGIGPGQLGASLLAQVLALVVVITTIAPRLADRLGPVTLARWSALGYALLTVLPGVAPSWPWFTAALVLHGAVNALLDLSIARLVSGAERASGRTLFAYLDIPAALGSLLGAGLGALAAGRLALPTYAALLAAAAALIVLAAWPYLPAAPPRTEQPATAAHVPVKSLCVLAGAGMWMELSVLDWSSLLYRELGAAPTAYGVGTLAFVLGLTLALTGTGWLADRFGPLAVIRGAAALALLGMLCATLPTSPLTVAAALVVAGLGVAPMHPLALSRAGRGSARDQARVMAASYVGSALSKPIIGAVAALATVQLALGMTGVALALVVLLLSLLLRPWRPRARPSAV